MAPFKFQTQSYNNSALNKDVANYYLKPTHCFPRFWYKYH